METKKLNNFLFAVPLLLIFACKNSQNENSSMIVRDLNIGNKTDMILVDSTDGNLIFIDTIEINKLQYIVQCVYKNDYDYPYFQLIKNGDTIEFDRNEFYITDSIYDINNDNRNDFNIMYQATQGFVIISYLFDKKTNKLSTIPDTIYQEKLP